MNPSTRLAARFRKAYEFPSEDARKKYLHDHPKAKPENHTVKEKGDESAKPEESKGKAEHKDEDKGGHPKKDKGETPKQKGQFFKGLSEKAKAFVTKSSAAVQKFVSDEEHRAKVMVEAGKTIMASPKTYAKRLVQTAKEEVHEFKEAGGALKNLAQGKKLDHHQKKALKTVAIHMGIAVAAAALTSTGVLSGAAALGKGMVQKIALKAAAHSLEKVHLVQEIQHIGHGAHELMHFVASEDDEEEDRQVETIDPEEAFAILIMQSVIKTMNELDDQDMAEILEEASGEQEKQAFKVGATLVNELPETLIDCLAVFGKIDAWAGRFNSVLVSARTESEGLGDRVWQTRFVQYFKDGEDFLEKIRDLGQALDDMYVEKATLAQIISDARQTLMIPQKAQITYAISDIDFQPDPSTGRDGITYSIDTLKEWSSALGAWSGRSQQVLRQLSAKAKRLL